MIITVSGDYREGGRTGGKNCAAPIILKGSEKWTLLVPTNKKWLGVISEIGLIWPQKLRINGKEENDVNE